MLSLLKIISIYQFITEFTIVNTNKYLNSYENLTCLKVDINIPIRWISLIVNFILCLCLIQLIFGILKVIQILYNIFKYIYLFFYLKKAKVFLFFFFFFFFNKIVLQI